MLKQGARHLDRQPVPSPIVGRQLDSEDRGSLFGTRPAEARAAAQPCRTPFEYPELAVQAWRCRLPRQKEVEQFLRVPFVRIVEAIKAPVAPIGLIGEEGLPVGGDEVPQLEPRDIDEHGRPTPPRDPGAMPRDVLSGRSP